jgi:hypothetical protein
MLISKPNSKSRAILSWQLCDSLISGRVGFWQLAGASNDAIVTFHAQV